MSSRMAMRADSTAGSLFGLGKSGGALIDVDGDGRLCDWRWASRSWALAEIRAARSVRDMFRLTNDNSQ